MAQLVCSNVNFGYHPQRAVLRDVSLTVSSGTMTGIVGPNGSGKSTLLRLLSGLIRPEAGVVELDGAALSGMDRQRIARRIAFMPQMVAPMFGFTVREVVALGRYAHLGAFGFLKQRDVEAVEKALVETDAVVFGDRAFMELSGGERQRVLVASVLAQEPEIMLLDEPTASLDIHHQVAIFGLLSRLARSGIAVAVVTHDLNLAGQFCGRLAILGDGRIVREGTCDEVIDEALLEEVYRTRLAVERNPVTGRPLVVILGEEDHR